MAGDDDGDGVGGVGGGYGADGLYAADVGCLVFVGAGLTVGDGLEGLPDFELEFRAGGVERDSKLR